MQKKKKKKDPNTKKWLWLSRLWVIFLLVGFLAGYFILQVPLNSSTGTGQTSKGNSNNSNSADSSGGNGKLRWI